MDTPLASHEVGRGYLDTFMILDPRLSVYSLLQHPELPQKKTSACHPFVETHSTEPLQAPGGDRGQDLHPAEMLLICNRYLRQSA